MLFSRVLQSPTSNGLTSSGQICGFQLSSTPFNMPVSCLRQHGFATDHPAHKLPRSLWTLRRILQIGYHYPPNHARRIIQYYQTSPPCFLSAISGWRGGALYPLAGGSRAARRRRRFPFYGTREALAAAAELGDSLAKTRIWAPTSAGQGAAAA